jgi:hypothetical protein
MPAPGMPLLAALPRGGVLGKILEQVTGIMYQHLMSYCLPPLQQPVGLWDSHRFVAGALGIQLP